jgi:hypothetical protein
VAKDRVLQHDGGTKQRNKETNKNGRVHERRPEVRKKYGPKQLTLVEEASIWY